MSVENWLPIPGFPGYEVSDFGWVKSLRIKKGPPFLTPYNNRGYLQVTLFQGGKAHWTCIHRLVALAFLGPRPEGMEVCHNDDNPLNNRLENLRYDTHQANMQDAVRNERGVGRRKKQLPTPIEAKEQT